MSSFAKETNSKRIDSVTLYKPKFTPKSGSKRRGQIKAFHIVFLFIYMYMGYWCFTTVGGKSLDGDDGDNGDNDDGNGRHSSKDGNAMTDCTFLVKWSCIQLLTQTLLSYAHSFISLLHMKY